MQIVKPNGGALYNLPDGEYRVVSALGVAEVYAVSEAPLTGTITFSTGETLDLAVDAVLELIGSASVRDFTLTGTSGADYRLLFMGAPQNAGGGSSGEETDPIWTREKSQYATQVYVDGKVSDAAGQTTSQISVINNTVNSLSSAVAVLGDNDVTLGDRITELTTSLADATYDITDLTTRISALETALQSISAATGQNASDLAAHLKADADLYQTLYAAILEQAQVIYDGSTPNLDMTRGEVIIGTGGVLSLNVTGETWTAPGNGAVVIVYKALLLGVSPVAMQNGVEVFGDGLSLLGLGSGTPVTVRTDGGDVWTFSGSLGLLDSFNVTFYPNASA